jgi:mono/diheme cytochrome c family protein
MVTSTRFRILPATILSLLITASISVGARARDDVPAELLTKKNPVALEEGDLRYYQRQFKGKCARCHGHDGTGKGKQAQTAENAVAPRNFTDADYMDSRSDGQLFYQILMGGGDRCAMPAFGPESDHAWSEDKIWHMVAFIRRFSQIPKPSVMPQAP